jgi:hypothetical protein
MLASYWGDRYWPAVPMLEALYAGNQSERSVYQFLKKNLPYTHKFIAQILFASNFLCLYNNLLLPYSYNDNSLCYIHYRKQG